MNTCEMISCKVNRYSAAENIFVADEKLTAIEIALEIFLNGKKFSQCFCSPGDVEDLVVGSLAQAGKIRSIDDVEKISVDAKNFVANVTTNQRTIDANSSAINFSCDVHFVAKDILACADELLSQLSTTHDKTNGVHSGIIFEPSLKKIDTTNPRAIDDDGSAKNFKHDVHFVAENILNCADELLSKLSTTHDKTNGVHSGIIFEPSLKKIDTTNPRTIDDDGSAKNFKHDVHFVAENILNCADKLLSELSTTHDKTNGVHSGILSDGKKILVFREDVGRHNVFDKIHGWSIRNRVDLSDKIIIFSGRCSCEMIQKLARMKIPAVLAKSVPTTLSISLAKKLGITLAARLAAGSFCIYTNPQRIVLS